MDALPRGEVIRCMVAWADQLEMVLHHLDEHQAEETGKAEVPPLVAAIFDHTRVHLATELGWPRDLLARVKAGEGP